MESPSALITIRPAQRTDTPQLMRIERASFADPWNKLHLEEDSGLVAELDGRIGGFLIWRQCCSAHGTEPPEFEILNLAVDSAQRRRGIAAALLGKLLETAGTYFLEVRESNTAARRLYTRFGFKTVGTRKNYYRHPIESAIVMQMKRC